MTGLEYLKRIVKRKAEEQETFFNFNKGSASADKHLYKMQAFNQVLNCIEAIENGITSIPLEDMPPTYNPPKKGV